MYYERIDINGDPERLPKETGEMIFHCNFDGTIKYSIFKEEFKQEWIDIVKWYEQPCEIPEPDKRDELIEKYRELVKSMTRSDAVRDMAYIKKELALMYAIEQFENNLNQGR